MSRELVTLQVALISVVLVVGSASAVIANRAATFDNGMDTSGLFTIRTIYVPVPQFTGPSTRIVVRPAVDETRARSAMYEALARVDSTLAPEIERYDADLERTTLVASTIAKLFVGCSLFAALLAISGIYGMSSNSVVLRAHEIGLRRALGASNADIVATFVRQGVRQLARGLGVSALLSALVLFAINQGFSVGAGTLALLGATVVVVVTACVLSSIYLAVYGIIRLEPSAALRSD